MCWLRKNIVIGIDACGFDEIAIRAVHLKLGEVWLITSLLSNLFKKSKPSKLAIIAYYFYENRLHRWIFISEIINRMKLVLLLLRSFVSLITFLDISAYFKYFM